MDKRIESQIADGKKLTIRKIAFSPTPFYLAELTDSMFYHTGEGDSVDAALEALAEDLKRLERCKACGGTLDGDDLVVCSGCLADEQYERQERLALSYPHLM